MLMNIAELMGYLEKELYYCEYFSLQKETPKHFDWSIPFKYAGIYERIGYVNVWNDVGSVEYEFPMYRPIGGGTIVYDVS